MSTDSQNNQRAKKSGSQFILTDHIFKNTLHRKQRQMTNTTKPEKENRKLLQVHFYIRKSITCKKAYFQSMFKFF